MYVRAYIIYGRIHAYFEPVHIVNVEFNDYVYCYNYHQKSGGASAPQAPPLPGQFAIARGGVARSTLNAS